MLESLVLESKSGFGSSKGEMKPRTERDGVYEEEDEKRYFKKYHIKMCGNKRVV